MKTLKSTAVIFILMGVLYGVYIALSPPPTAAPSASGPLEAMQPPLIEYAGGGAAPQTTPQLFPPATPPVDAQPQPPGPSFAANSPAAAETSPQPLAPASAAPLVGSDPLAAAGEAAPFRRSNYETQAAASPPPESQAAAASEPSPPAPAESAGPPSVALENPARSPEIVAFDFRQAWQSVERKVAAGKLRSALAELSPYYNHPQLAADERARVLDWLDALAGKVIYSSEHHLEAPYRVQGRENLYEVADRYRIPAPLLRNVNAGAVSDTGVLLPGTELKVIPGPFRADVNVAAAELTLYLGDLYAGRFPFTVGDEPPQAGAYKVLDKRTDRDYYGRNGQVIPAQDPANPYGGFWLDLGREACLHGSPGKEGAPALGCISLSPRDAQDVYGILGLNSEVRILR